MTRLDLLKRIITATVLVALAVTLGVWLARAPLTTAAPAAPLKIAPEPTPAPPPPVPVRPVTTVIEVPVEVEIAAAAEPPSVATTTEPKPEPKPASLLRRRGLFRHR